MRDVTIGELSHRFALQAPARAADGGGGASVTWGLIAEVWGALRPVSGGEAGEADGVRGRLTHEIWIRHRDGVTPDMRLVLGARVIEIRAVIAHGWRHRFLRCQVEERAP
jgi:SPP1 family predicted phage head-tail adaptor